MLTTPRLAGGPWRGKSENDRMLSRVLSFGLIFAFSIQPWQIIDYSIDQRYGEDGLGTEGKGDGTQSVYSTECDT